MRCTTFTKMCTINCHHTFTPNLAINKGMWNKSAEVFVPGAQNQFPFFVKLLAESGSGFFAPSGLTYVDFVVAVGLDVMRKMDPDTVGAFPELVAFVDRVYGQPKLKKYLSTKNN